MTKKDYIRAAKIVSGIKTGSNASLCAWQTREAFVIFFSGENPRFDVDRFRVACGDIAEQYQPNSADNSQLFDIKVRP